MLIIKSNFKNKLQKIDQLSFIKCVKQIIRTKQCISAKTSIKAQKMLVTLGKGINNKIVPQIKTTTNLNNAA